MTPDTLDFGRFVDYHEVYELYEPKENLRPYIFQLKFDT